MRNLTATGTSYIYTYIYIYIYILYNTRHTIYVVTILTAIAFAFIQGRCGYSAQSDCIGIGSGRRQWQSFSGIVAHIFAWFEPIEGRATARDERIVGIILAVEALQGPFALVVISALSLAHVTRRVGRTALAPYLPVARVGAAGHVASLGVDQFFGLGMVMVAHCNEYN